MCENPAVISHEKAICDYFDITPNTLDGWRSCGFPVFHPAGSPTLCVIVCDALDWIRTQNVKRQRTAQGQPIHSPNLALDGKQAA